MINPKMNYLSLKHLSRDEQPREKLIEHGRTALSNAEIVAILIGSGTTEKSAVELSREILISVNGDLARLAKLSVHDLMKFKGIGEAKAVSIAAALELGRRKQNIGHNKDVSVKSSRDLFLHVKDKFVDIDHEEFYIILLNRANKVKAIELISKGGISGTAVDGKIIFKKALTHSASAVILCHNHPSGTLYPSSTDIELTKKLIGFGKMIEMPVLDHLIVADNKYYSFADEGLIG